MTADTTAVPIPDQQAPAAPVTVIGQVLATDRLQVLLMHPADGRSGLPGARSAQGTSPAQAATTAATGSGLPNAGVGRLLATDWRTVPGQGPVLVHVYDHPLLAPGRRAAGGEQAAGGMSGPLLVPAADLATVTDEAPVILAALAARAEGRVAELDNGRHRAPGVLDRLGLLSLVRPAPLPASSRWHAPEPDFDGCVEHVRALLAAPDGRVLIHHTPATGRTRLPGGTASPEETIDDAMARLCATTVGVRPEQPALLGYQSNGASGQARFLAAVSTVAPLPAGPCVPATVRLLVCLEQLADVCDDPVGAEELEAARERITELGLPTARRQPVTELPAGGVLL